MLNINLLNVPGKQVEGVEEKVIPTIQKKTANLKSDIEKTDIKSSISPLKSSIKIIATIILFIFVVLYYYFKYYD